MKTRIRHRWNPVVLAATLLAVTPIAVGNAAGPASAATKTGRAGSLDLRLPSPETPGAARSPEDPRYATDVGSRSPKALLPVADRDGDFYRSKPIFQHEQRLQVLDTEVPVSVKLGKWKTAEESKALGLSATVPLKVLD